MISAIVAVDTVTSDNALITHAGALYGAHLAGDGTNKAVIMLSDSATTSVGATVLGVLSVPAVGGGDSIPLPSDGYLRFTAGIYVHVLAGTMGHLTLYTSK